MLKNVHESADNRRFFLISFDTLLLKIRVRIVSQKNKNITLTFSHICCSFSTICCWFDDSGFHEPVYLAVGEAGGRERVLCNDCMLGRCVSEQLVRQ